MTPPPAATHVAAPTALRLTAPVELRTPLAERVVTSASWSRLRLLVDAIVLSLAASAAVFGATSLQLSGSSRLLSALFPFLVLGILHLRGNPEDRLSSSVVDTFSHIVGAVSLAGMLLIAVFSMVGETHPVALALRLWLFSAFYLGIARVTLRSVRAQAVRTGGLATPTLIVGAGLVGEHLIHRLLQNPAYGLLPVGLLDASPPPRRLTGADFVPLLGGPEALLEAVERTGARHVIIAFSQEPDAELVTKIEACRRAGIEVSLVPRMYELINERSTLDHVGGMPLLSLRPTNPRSWEFAIKHASDRVLAACALVLLAPLLLAVAVAVRRTSPGPIFFRQRRVGRDGRGFDLLKFRTMLEGADHDEFVPEVGLAPGGVEGTDRRTRIGPFLRGTALDELPQLINVLRGEMSLVGPRPERPEFVDRFTEEIDGYDGRHRVKAGITGWAQVCGLRGQTSIADRVEWDNFYIQNWSLRFDLRIIALTFAEVLRFRG